MSHKLSPLIFSREAEEKEQHDLGSDRAFRVENFSLVFISGPFPLSLGGVCSFTLDTTFAAAAHRTATAARWTWMDETPQQRECMCTKGKGRNPREQILEQKRSPADNHNAFTQFQSSTFKRESEEMIQVSERREMV